MAPFHQTKVIADTYRYIHSISVWTCLMDNLPRGKRPKILVCLHSWASQPLLLQSLVTNGGSSSKSNKPEKLPLLAPRTHILTIANNSSLLQKLFSFKCRPFKVVDESVDSRRSFVYGARELSRRSPHRNPRPRPLCFSSATNCSTSLCFTF